MVRSQPIRPDYSAIPGSNITSLARAALAVATAEFAGNRGDDALDIIAKNWPHDRIAAVLLTRAATNPLTLATGPIQHAVLADFVASLSGASAGSTLLAQGLQLNFDNSASISIPGLSFPPGETIPFVGEGQPIPATELNATGGPILRPTKFGILTTLSSEMISSSNAEALTRTALTEAAGQALDTVLFDDLPAAPERPAGLRFNIPPLPASGAADRNSALITDIAALVAACAPVAGPTGAVTIVTDPGLAAIIRLRMPREWGLSILASTAPSIADIVIAVSPTVLASALGALFIGTSPHSTIHMNTVPLPITAPGPQYAVPLRSTWQTDTVNLKLTWQVNWVVRDPRGVNWIQPANWQ